MIYVIVVVDVIKCYGDFVVFDYVDFVVLIGLLIVLLGFSGLGKLMLLCIIVGFD